MPLGKKTFITDDRPATIHDITLLADNEDKEERHIASTITTPKIEPLSVKIGPTLENQCIALSHTSHRYHLGCN
jgi:hypothetical protein